MKNMYSERVTFAVVSKCSGINGGRSRGGLDEAVPLCILKGGRGGVFTSVYPKPSPPGQRTGELCQVQCVSCVLLKGNVAQ